MSNYNINDITIVNIIEAVKQRPTTYGIDIENPHGLIYEIFANSLDEHLAGHGNLIKIILQKDGGITIEDFGRGIPPEVNTNFNKTGIDICFTSMHGGSKIVDGNTSYKQSLGTNSIGATLVNITSDLLYVFVKRYGKIFKETFKSGYKIGEQELIGTYDEKVESTGTKVTFYPTAKVFVTLELDMHKLHHLLDSTCYMNPALTIKLYDERHDKIKETVFNHANGLEDYIKNKLETKSSVIHNIVIDKELPIIKLEDESGKTYYKHNLASVKTIITFTDGNNEDLVLYANSGYMPEGGSPLTILRSSLVKSINEIGRKNKILKDKEPDFDSALIRNGLLGILSVKVNMPRFKGNEKRALINSDINGDLGGIYYKEISNFLDDNPKDLLAIIEKLRIVRLANEASKRAKEAILRPKSTNKLSRKCQKLADCISKNADEIEIFFVEGDSAGGSAKQARDNKTQAVMPLRGKPLNSQKYSITDLLASKNTEIENIILALGIINKNNDFDVKLLNYKKIIILADADVDGLHIIVLLLTLFNKLLPELITGGYVYIGNSPLFEVTEIGNKKNVEYFYFKEDYDLYCSKNDMNKFIVKRFKGLGELNPDILKKTTMDASSRVLTQVTVDDINYCNEILHKLMDKESGDSSNTKKLLVDGPDSF